jgi:hypothetical protein
MSYTRLPVPVSPIGADGWQTVRALDEPSSFLFQTWARDWNSLEDETNIA